MKKVEYPIDKHSEKLKLLYTDLGKGSPERDGVPASFPYATLSGKSNPALLLHCLENL